LSGKVIQKSLDIVKAKLEKREEPKFTSTENWATVKDLSDAAFSSCISAEGVDRLKCHYEALNKQVGSLKQAYYAREDKNILKTCIPPQNPQWNLLQGKDFRWQSRAVSKSAYADCFSAMTRLSMDSRPVHDRLSCADRIKNAADKTLEEIFNKFIAQK